MARLALVVLVAVAAGCADPPADEGTDGVVQDSIISNEAVDGVATPDLEAEAQPDTTGPAQAEVAGQTVPTRAVVTDMESGDQACSLSVRTDDGSERTVFADYSVCNSDAVVGRRVQIEYIESTVVAASCEGDPDCLDTETVALAVVAEPID